MGWWSKRTELNTRGDGAWEVGSVCGIEILCGARGLLKRLGRSSLEKAGFAGAAGVQRPSQNVCTILSIQISGAICCSLQSEIHPKKLTTRTSCRQTPTTVPHLLAPLPCTIPGALNLPSPPFTLHAAPHPRATCLSDACIVTLPEALVFEKVPS